MTWNEYIQNLIAKPLCLDNLKFSLYGEGLEFNVPHIIKCSILMNEKMATFNKNCNLFVFPEKNQIAYMFTVFKTIYDITEGHTAKTYDPYSFQKHQRLKYKDCVFEFDSIETDDKDGTERIYLKFADMTRYGLPVEIAPFLQQTDSKRPLSKFAALTKVYNVKAAQVNENIQANDAIQDLLNYKTHLAYSTYFISPVNRSKDFVYKSTINGKKISQTLLTGQVDMLGNLKILGAGQLSGTPALSLATDIYSVEEALEKGAQIDSIIVEISNINVIESQLDVLDRLLKKEIPIICITNTINSLDLSIFEDRDFQIWRWNEKNITNQLFGSLDINADHKIENCSKQNIEYIYCEGKEISNIFSILYKEKNEVSEESIQIMSIFDKLHSIAFIALRYIIPFNKNEVYKIIEDIDDCMNALQCQKKYITIDMFSNFTIVIENLKKIFAEKLFLTKTLELQEHMKLYYYRSISFIIPDKADKNRYISYWESFVKSKKMKTKIQVFYADEYCDLSNLITDLTVVTGWFNKISMRKILFSYTTSNFLILLYDYERRWQASHLRFWKKALDSSGNGVILKEAFDYKYDIDNSRNDNNTDNESNNVDELGEIEAMLRENKYRQYISNGGKTDVEPVEAIPITFIGDNLGFYKPTHKMIIVTDIIVYDTDEIKIKQAIDVKIGDFIVIRDAQRDIIREIAEDILLNSGKSDSIVLARKWKDALEIESCFSNVDEIYERLCSVGCTRGKATIEQWIKDDERIAPQSKDDIMYIAQVTEDAVLSEKLDEIFEAAQDVKRAHIKAGQILSQRLKKQIVSQLYSINKIDPYNIWDPISFDVEALGGVTILKIIDKSKPIFVDPNNLNRLI